MGIAWVLLAAAGGYWLGKSGRRIFGNPDRWVYHCSICGDEVEAETGTMREHLAGHHGYAWTFEADEIREVFAEMDPEGPHLIEDDE
jgi:hypothetical protein